MHNDISKLSGDKLIDLERLRERLKQMSDIELKRFGRAAAYMGKPTSQLKPGDAPREVFMIDAEEAHAEWVEE